MDDEFLATAYLKVHENLKLITDERVIEENPESHSGSMSSMKNFDDTYNFGDQFLYDKPTEDDQGGKSKSYRGIKYSAQEKHDSDDEEDDDDDDGPSSASLASGDDHHRRVVDITQNHGNDSVKCCCLRYFIVSKTELSRESKKISKTTNLEPDGSNEGTGNTYYGFLMTSTVILEPQVKEMDPKQGFLMRKKANSLVGSNVVSEHLDRVDNAGDDMRGRLSLILE
ncbi:hypothetical protein Tco_0954870 [Tanacetum coccineum]|uniref:Uncharacterized protein n=1 Tax=Tanacetum coccineum TaxID=301880 RepID=A0ABQ5E5L0_9ASTR